MLGKEEPCEEPTSPIELSQSHLTAKNGNTLRGVGVMVLMKNTFGTPETFTLLRNYSESNIGNNNFQFVLFLNLHAWNCARKYCQLSEGTALLFRGGNAMAVMKNIVWVPRRFYSGQTRVVRPPIALPWNQKKVLLFHRWTSEIIWKEIFLIPKGMPLSQLGVLAYWNWEIFGTESFDSWRFSSRTALNFCLSQVGQVGLIIDTNFFAVYLGTFWVAVSEKTAEVPLKDSKLRTYGNLDMETSN